MQSAIVLIIVSIIDIPSIISIIGGMRAKKLWLVGLVAILAAILGEALNASLHSAYSMFSLFPYRLIAQVIVAFSVFGIAQKIRKRSLANIDQAKSKSALLVMVLLLSFSCLGAGVFFLGIKQGEVRMSDVARRAELDALDAQIRANIKAQQEQTERVNLLGGPTSIQQERGSK